MSINFNDDLASENNWLDQAVLRYAETGTNFPGFLICQMSGDLAEHAATSVAQHLGCAISILKNFTYLNTSEFEQVLHGLEQGQFLFLDRVDFLDLHKPDHVEFVRLIDKVAERVTLVASAADSENVPKKLNERLQHTLKLAQKESAKGGISVPIGVWRPSISSSSNSRVVFAENRKVLPTHIHSYGASVGATELTERPVCKLLQIVGSDKFQTAESPLTAGIGLDSANKPYLIDLQRTGSLLIVSQESASGSHERRSDSKNILHSLLLSLMYKAKPKDVRFMAIDDDPFEFQSYCDSAFSLCPLIRPKNNFDEKVSYAIDWISAETNKRISLFQKMGVRDTEGFNSKINLAKAKGEFICNPFSLSPENPEPLQSLPYILVFITDLANFVGCITPQSEEEYEQSAKRAEAILMFSRCIRNASKVGIKFICELDPNNNEVGLQGLIREFGSNLLLSHDLSEMLCKSLKPEVQQPVNGLGYRLVLNQRLMPVLVSVPDIKISEQDRILGWWRDLSDSDYIDGVLLDDMFNNDPYYDMAVQVVLSNRKASISLVQRHLKIGYNRAARLVEGMERAGLVSQMNGQGQRSILVATKSNSI